MKSFVNLKFPIYRHLLFPLKKTKTHLMLTLVAYVSNNDNKMHTFSHIILAIPTKSHKICTPQAYRTGLGYNQMIRGMSWLLPSYNHLAEVVWRVNHSQRNSGWVAFALHYVRGESLCAFCFLGLLLPPNLDPWLFAVMPKSKRSNHILKPQKEKRVVLM